MSEVENEDLRNVKVILDVELELFLRKMVEFLDLLSVQLENPQDKEIEFTLKVIRNGLDQIKSKRLSTLKFLEFNG